MAGRAMGAFGPVRFPVFPPSGCEGVRTDENPLEGPALAYVHGFHAAARPAAVFLGEQRVAFAAGRLVVELEVSTCRQRFVHGHSDAITCLANSLEQGLGASGQVRRAGAKCAEVLLWSVETMQVRASFVFHQADIEAVGFTHGGEVLVSIGADRDHTMAIWAAAWEGPLRLRRREGVPLTVCSAYKSGGVRGVLAAPGSSDRPAQFATFGACHVKFWQSDRLAPATVDGRRGAFGPEGPPRVVVAVAWAARDRLVAGGSDGEVYFFEGTRAIRRVHQQQFCVALLMPRRDSLLAVYAHGTCSLLRSAHTMDVELSSLAGAPEARMQSAVVGGATWRNSRLLLVSRTHLMLLDLVGGAEQLQSCTVLLAQPSRPLTAICAHPAEPCVFTGALDGGVRCYRTDTQRQLPERSFKAPGGVTCLAVSSCMPGAASAWLAVGCEDSTLSIVGEASFNYVFRRCLSPRKSRLTCASFSTCDASGAQPLWLAVGAEDGCIHTFRFKEAGCKTTTHSGAETVTKVATLRGHAAPVFDLSFADTLPSVFLLSVDTSGHALAFDVPMARRLPSLAQVRDLPFVPWTSPIGWQVLGCWTQQRTTEPAALPPRRFCEVPGRAAIAASDASRPAVELFPFPCPTPPLQPPVRLEGPAAPVAAVLHGGCSDCLLAASDTVLFVWEWPRRPAARQPVAPVADAGSPLRPAYGGVLFETPEGRRRAMASDSASQQLTPQPRTPQRRSPSAGCLRLGKESPEASSASKGRPPGRVLGRSPQSPPEQPSLARPRSWSPTPQAHEEAPCTPCRPGPSPGSGAPASGAAELAAGFPDVAPLPGDGGEQRERFASPAAYPAAPMAAWGPELPLAECAAEQSSAVAPARAADWAIQLPRAQDACRAPLLPGQRQGAGKVVSPKIGACETAQVASHTQRIREDTEARARAVHERQQFDTVGVLLGGPGRQAMVTVAAPEGSYSESAAGKFIVRCRDAGTRYEVEARLPGGRLRRVLRNPLRQTLTFEGEVLSHWAHGGAGGGPSAAEYLEERLVVRLPGGFDLAAPPARVERGFVEGRCLVEVQRCGEGPREFTPGAEAPAGVCYGESSAAVQRGTDATRGDECAFVDGWPGG